VRFSLRFEYTRFVTDFAGPWLDGVIGAFPRGTDECFRLSSPSGTAYSGASPRAGTFQRESRAIAA